MAPAWAFVRSNHEVAFMVGAYLFDAESMKRLADYIGVRLEEDPGISSRTFGL